jgi:hypothetical protein
MPAFAALTLTDSASANHVLNPTAIDSSGVAKWLGAETVYDGKVSCTQSVSLPKNGSTVVRVKQRIAIPVMDAVDATKKVGEAYVNVEYVMPKQAPLATRLDLKAYLADLTGESLTTAALTSFESAY